MKSLRVACLLVSVLAAVACSGGRSPTVSADVAATPTPTPCPSTIPDPQTIKIVDDGDGFCRLEPAMCDGAYEAVPGQVWTFVNDFGKPLKLNTSAKIAKTDPKTGKAFTVYLFCDDANDADCRDTGITVSNKPIEKNEPVVVQISQLAASGDKFQEYDLISCSERPRTGNPRDLAGATFKIRNPPPMEAKAE